MGHTARSGALYFLGDTDLEAEWENRQRKNHVQVLQIISPSCRQYFRFYNLGSAQELHNISVNE